MTASPNAAPGPRRTLPRRPPLAADADDVTPPDASRTVFISYRRQISWQLARLVFNELREHGFDAFMDVESMGSGDFERVILTQIAARAHFIVLLEPGSLDGITEQDDWLRREIAHAIVHKRNVVPLTVSGFTFPQSLPTDIASLKSSNAVPVQHIYFYAAMHSLRQRFLQLPESETPNLMQTPVDTKAAVEARINRALWGGQDARDGARLSAPNVSVKPEKQCISQTRKAGCPRHME